MTSTTAKTTAELVAADLGDDGQQFRRPLRAGELQDDGDREGEISLATLCERAGARVEREGGATAYRFADGSGIVAQIGGWDLAAGPDCLCWAGAGHSEDCPARCRAPGCARSAGTARGLCPAHYQQQRRAERSGVARPTRPIRETAAGRIGVRLSAAALAALGDEPAVRAREVIEAWAKGRR